MNKTIFFIMLLIHSANLSAGQVENITACVSKAKEFIGVSLDEFKAQYEGNIFSLSTVSWPGIRCEVKLGKVYNLNSDNTRVIYEGFAGVDSYELDQELSAKTKQATIRLQNEISNLRQSIALLEDRMGSVSTALTKAKPDHSALTGYIDDGINKALSGLAPRDERIESSEVPPTPAKRIPSTDNMDSNQPKELTPLQKCVQRGVKYYKAIGSYPTLYSEPNKGRLAEDVAIERCNRTLTAFPDI